MIRAIAAISKDRVIGAGGTLPWRLRGDLQHFHDLTSDHGKGGVIIMGSRTYTSIPKRPLSDRVNIVVTRDEAYTEPGVLVAHSLEEGIELAQHEGFEDIWIGGGAQVYARALPYTDQLDMTLVDTSVAGDTFFPEFEQDFEKIDESEAMEENGLTYRYVTYRRRASSPVKKV